MRREKLEFFQHFLVSVIVRTKDRLNHLRIALNSIKKQIYRPIEAIIINDGGESISQEYIKDNLGDISFKYIEFKTTQGRAKAANTGILYANGKYIAFLDDDDEFLNDHLYILVKSINESKSKIAYTDALKVKREITDFEIKEYIEGIFSSYDFSYIDLLTENYIPLITLLFQKDVLLDYNGFDEQFELYEDWDLLLRITQKYKPLHIAKPTVKYTFWNKKHQIAQDKTLRLKYYNMIFNKHKEKYSADVILNLKKKHDILQKEFQKSIKNIEELRKEYKEFIKKSEVQIKKKTDEIHALKLKVKQQEDINKMLQKKIDLLENELEKIINTIGWKLLTRLRMIRDKIVPYGSKRRSLYDHLLLSFKKKTTKEISLIFKDEYQQWIAKNEPDAKEIKLQTKDFLNFRYKPKISIVVPVFNPEKDMLVSMIESVVNQSYDNWELCIADGNSELPYVKDILKKYAKNDKRIKVTFLDRNYNISGNSNYALQMAEGEFIGFLDHDDELAPFALYEVVKAINKYNNDVDIIYSDEDKISPSGKRCYPFFKPDWSIELFLCVNYLCHFLVIKKSIIEKIGGFRDGYNGAQDYDLLLRCISETKKIIHIPMILYHWRMHKTSTALDIFSKPSAHKSGKKALKDYLNRNNILAEVYDTKNRTNYRVKYKIVDNPMVSIIIPFKDKYSLLKKCITSIIQKSSYKNFELILVSNNTKEQILLEYIKNLKKYSFIKVLYYNEKFNYSRINNFAVKEAKGDILLFLNNDVEVITEDWMESMLEHAQRKEIGAVGCKLLYPNNRIQHAGVIVGLTGFAGHVFSGLPDSAYTYFGSVNFVRNYLAVTGACMMTRKEIFLQLGGFNEEFVLCGSDVEFCLRLIDKGYRIVYTPYAVLYHYESATRGSKIPVEDFKISKKYYEKYLNYGDPFYNKNLTLLKTDCSLKSQDEYKKLKKIRANATKEY